MKKLAVVWTALIGIGVASAFCGGLQRGVDVTADTDGRTLVIRYEVSGRAEEWRWTLPGEVVEFRYCPWIRDSGIAVAAMTRGVETTEFYYTAFRFEQAPKELKPARIPALPGQNKLLGIVNTGGDSLVITAIQHHREALGERVAGWTYIDNCPVPGLAIGQVTPFEIAVQRSSSPPK